MLKEKTIIAKGSRQGGFVKTAYLAVAALGLATGFLAWQNWSLKRQISTPIPPAGAPAATVPAPVPPPAPPVAVTTPAPDAPTPATAPKKAAVKAPAKPNYTQAKKELSATNPPQAEPAPTQIARVQPTDVSPAEPPLVPYPPTHSQASMPPARSSKISVTVPSGTILTVRLMDTLNTDRNQTGDSFRASLDDPVIVNGNIVLPRGTTVQGRIVDSQQAGRVSGVAEMSLALNQVQAPGGGGMLPIETDTVRRQGETSTKSDAAKVGVGSAIGAVIGAVAGGGKGAAIGAATGAGAGTAGVLLTRGKPLTLSQETVLSFQLNSPVTLEVTPGQEADAEYNPPRSAPRSSGDWDRDRPVLRRRTGQ